MIGAMLMREVVGRGIGVALGLGLVLLSSGTPETRARADDSRMADYFGFQPLEIYKLDTRINNLLLKDLDGDKIDMVHQPLPVIREDLLALFDISELKKYMTKEELAGHQGAAALEEGH